MNPPLGALSGKARSAAADSARMNWRVPDAAPTERVNRILWGVHQGSNAPCPAPKNAIFSPLSLQVDDDDPRLGILARDLPRLQQRRQSERHHCPSRTAQLISHWSLPCGNPLSQYGWNRKDLVRTSHGHPAAACVTERRCRASLISGIGRGNAGCLQGDEACRLWRTRQIPSVGSWPDRRRCRCSLMSPVTGRRRSSAVALDHTVRALASHALRSSAASPYAATRGRVLPAAPIFAVELQGAQARELWRKPRSIRIRRPRRQNRKASIGNSGEIRCAPSLP